MKLSTITATLTALISATLAAATPLDKRFDVSATFHGANGQSYTMSFPTDDSSVDISMSSFPHLVRQMLTLSANPMVVYGISSPGGGFCTFTGVKGETVVIYAEDRKSLQTPQAMEWGSCQNN